MPLANEPADWRKERALSDLEMAEHVRRSAANYLHEVEGEYGERWAKALQMYSRDELLGLGYQEPTVQCGRDPERLKAMISRPHGGYAPPEAQPSLLEHTDD